ncbi:hypothetical protein Gotur_025951 [Gossypium turneri]
MIVVILFARERVFMVEILRYKYRQTVVCLNPKLHSPEINVIWIVPFGQLMNQQKTVLKRPQTTP